MFATNNGVRRRGTVRCKSTLFCTITVYGVNPRLNMDPKEEWCQPPCLLQTMVRDEGELHDAHQLFIIQPLSTIACYFIFVLQMLMNAPHSPMMRQMAHTTLPSESNNMSCLCGCLDRMIATQRVRHEAFSMEIVLIGTTQNEITCMEPMLVGG